MYVTLRETSSRRGSGQRRRGRVAGSVVLLGVVSMLTDISSESVSAILPLYLTAVLGLGPIAYGVVDGLYQGVSALVRLLGGWLADRGDHPKRVAALGYGLSALARVALLPATGLAAITGVVVVDRLGKGLRTAPRDALISAASDPRDLGRAFGVHRSLDTLGAVIGPLLAFAVLASVPGGYSTVFVLSLGFAVVGVAVLLLLVPDLQPRRAAAASSGAPLPRSAPSWRLVLDPRLRRLLVVAAVLGVLTVGDGFLYLALQRRDDFAASWFPLLYVGTNAAYLVLALPLGRAADRVGRGRVLVLGHLALVGAYVAAAGPARGLVATLACLLLLGTFYAATDGALPALAGRLVDPSVRASGIATAQTVVAIARSLSSVGFGVLWATAGRTPALVSVAVVLLCVLPAAFRFVKGLDVGDRAAADMQDPPDDPDRHASDASGQGCA